MILRSEKINIIHYLNTNRDRVECAHHARIRPGIFKVIKCQGKTARKAYLHNEDFLVSNSIIQPDGTTCVPWSGQSTTADGTAYVPHYY